MGVWCFSGFASLFPLVFLALYWKRITAAGACADEVQSIVSGKLALKYSGADVDAMKSIAQAAHKRSIADFQKVQRRRAY